MKFKLLILVGTGTSMAFKTICRGKVSLSNRDLYLGNTVTRTTALGSDTHLSFQRNNGPNEMNIVDKEDFGGISEESGIGSATALIAAPRWALGLLLCPNIRYNLVLSHQRQDFV